MIVLIIGLPVYSSRVMAVNAVRIASIEGDDGFTEFRKRIDTTVMNVEVDLDGAESLSGNQLRTRINGNGPFLLFGQCSGSGGSFNCVSDRENILPGGTFSYQVNLFDEDGNYAGAQDTATIIVDDQAPTVTLFDVEPELGASSNVNVSFSLEDGAYATNNNDCVGLKKLEIRQDDLAGNLLNTVNIDNAPCDFTGNMTVSVPSGDGDFRLCVQAFDRFDQKSSGLRCDDFTVDSSLPQIESSALIDFNGKPIEFIGGNVIGASLIVNITDNDLIETSVKADLTDLELFPDTPRSSCQKIGTDKHKCLWNFNLILYETKAPIVQINAVDRAGNKLEAPVTLGTITRDIEGPIVTDITTSLGEFNGTNIIGDDFNFTATIDDVVGVSEGKVFLDLSGIGLGDNVKASSCTANSCTWVIGDINLGSGKTAKVKSTFTTRDDLGNAASEIKEIEVLVDKSKPKIINLEVNVVPGQVPLPEGFAIKGDVLSITANLTEETSVDAQLVTTIFGDVGPLEGNCQATTEENNHVCTWETPPIDISGPLNAQLFFTFTDFVGNAKGAQEQLFISRSDEDPDPNFYMSTVQCSPQFIDRQISEKLSVREYCHVTLSAVGVKAKPLITELAECTGDDMAFV
ncbi:MAG: hypothetical protein QF632_04185, partial [Candidatus Woesearchaeota archaeon]|nr:hypothetical protein [Candidatus Woesearchaeota archaeon]